MLVLAINRLLEVAEDPWGVADWWLGRNAWLDGIPAELLGRVDDTPPQASTMASTTRRVGSRRPVVASWTVLVA